MSNAGWWPDPSGRHELRYHDGAAWTDHVSDRGAVSADPVHAAPPVPPPPVPPPPLPTPTASLPPIVQASAEPTSFAAPSSGSDPFAPPTQSAAANPFSPPTQPYVAPYEAPVPQGFPVGAASPIIQEAGGPRRLWLGIALVGLLVLAGVIAFIATRDDDGETVDREILTTSVPGTVVTPVVTAPPGTEQPTTPTTPGTGAIAPPASGTTAPAQATDAPTAPVTAAPQPGVVPVGTPLVAEGSVVRVNRVTPNATVDDFFAPEAPASVTAVEIEACAGPDGFGLNTFSWTAFQADNTTLENFFFGDDVQSVQLAPGGCARGTITFEVPGGGAVDQLVLTGAAFDEVGRWTVAGGTEPADRLIAPVPPTVIPVGQTATVDAGHTVTLRSVTDNAPPLDDFFSPEPGRQYSQIDVELCAGTANLSVNGLYWFGVATDSWMGTAALLGDTLPLIDLAAGQCAAGIVQIDLPAGSVISQVVYTDQVLREQARWQVG